MTSPAPSSSLHRQILLSRLLLLLFLLRCHGAGGDKIDCDASGGTYSMGSQYDTNLGILGRTMAAITTTSKTLSYDGSVGDPPNVAYGRSRCSVATTCSMCIAMAAWDAGVYCAFLASVSISLSAGCEIEFSNRPLSGQSAGTPALPANPPPGSGETTLPPPSQPHSGGLAGQSSSGGSSSSNGKVYAYTIPPAVIGFVVVIALIVYLTRPPPPINNGPPPTIPPRPIPAVTTAPDTHLDPPFIDVSDLTVEIPGPDRRA